MKRKIIYYTTITIILTALSVFLFWLHYNVFGNFHETMYLALIELCFIPISVLSVTIVFENILKRRDKQEKLSKLHMLIGIYFSEVGFDMLKIIAKADPESKGLITNIDDFKRNLQILKKHPHNIEYKTVDYSKIQELLINNRSLFISLMANEGLLEHETFTDLLMDTIHLRDEFIFRKDKEYSEDDYSHIDSDIKRVYGMLSSQFLRYINSLEKPYPNLYRSSKRNNPFQ